MLLKRYRKERSECVLQLLCFYSFPASFASFFYPFSIHSSARVQWVQCSHTWSLEPLYANRDLLGVQCTGFLEWKQSTKVRYAYQFLCFFLSLDDGFLSKEGKHETSGQKTVPESQSTFSLSQSSHILWIRTQSVVRMKEDGTMTTAWKDVLTERNEMSEESERYRNWKLNDSFRSSSFTSLTEKKTRTARLESLIFPHLMAVCWCVIYECRGGIHQKFGFQRVREKAGGKKEKLLPSLIHMLSVWHQHQLPGGLQQSFSGYEALFFRLLFS